MIIATLTQYPFTSFFYIFPTTSHGLARSSFVTKMTEDAHDQTKRVHVYLNNVIKGNKQDTQTSSELNSANLSTKSILAIMYTISLFFLTSIAKISTLGPEMPRPLSVQLAASPHHSLTVLKGVWHFDKSFELICITMFLARCYDGLYYSLGCCVCPPGGFTVIWAQPGSHRRAINEH